MEGERQQWRERGSSEGEGKWRRGAAVKKETKLFGPLADFDHWLIRCLLGPCLIITIYIAAFSKAVLMSTNLSTNSEEDLRDSLLRPIATKKSDNQL